MKRISNITYVNDRDLCLDVYLPDTLNARGCVIFAHGMPNDPMGYRRAEVGHFAKSLTEAGLALASVQYRQNVTMDEFSTIDAQYIEAFMARGRRIGLTLAPDQVGPQFIAAAQDISDAMMFLRANGGSLGVSGQNCGILGVSMGGTAALGLAYPPHEWSGRFLRPKAVVTIAAAMAQPWRLHRNGPACLVIGSSLDPVIEYRNLDMIRLRAGQAGAPVDLIDTKEPGHLRQMDVALDGSDSFGRPYTALIRDHFRDALLVQRTRPLEASFA